MYISIKRVIQGESISTASHPLPHLWQTSLVKHKLLLRTWKQPENQCWQVRQYSLAMRLRVNKRNPSISLTTSTTQTPTFQTIRHHLIVVQEIEVVRNMCCCRDKDDVRLPSHSPREDPEPKRGRSSAFPWVGRTTMLNLRWTPFSVYHTGWARAGHDGEGKEHSISFATPLFS